MPVPILLLHGAIGSKVQLHELKSLLAAHRTVYDLNLNGHGGRVVPPVFSMYDFAGETAAFILSEAKGPVDIFGYSMGGYVALTLALQRPELVRRIVTLGTKLNWTPETAAKEASMLNPAKIREKVPLFAEALAQRHGTEHWETLLDRTAALLLNLGNGKALRDADFARIQQEVLILLGSDDNMVTREESEHVARILPHGAFRVLEGAKHPIEQVDAQVLAEAITAFLSGA